MPRAWVLIVVLLVSTGCATVPDGTYFPPPTSADTRVIASALRRAARAAGDDPARYSFGLIQSRSIIGYSAEDATFYFSEGLARQPATVVDALVAHEVAHEVLDHVGQRRALSLSLSAGFTAFGIVLPGLGLFDFVINPLLVQAFSRDQEITADARAVEILRAMGYPSPRGTLADALGAAVAINGEPRGWLLAREPPLAERLTALGPLESAPGSRRLLAGPSGR
jgi:Zn-dependent protease with chaperone function